MHQIDLPYMEIKKKIENAKAITILSHLNPDVDALGTALGIYALLHNNTQAKTEVVNASKDLPKNLDFLPNFKKIKHQMDYTDSLIIACDCGSIDRLGFDLIHRDIINIDHHESNTEYGSINVVLSQCASSSQVAFKLFKNFVTINAEAATCFYAALLSDTRYFTTSSVNKEVFSIAQSLIESGANPSNIAYHITQKRALSSLRILEKALASLSLHNDAKIATLKVSQADIIATGATISDMDGVVDYAKSLVTVEIAVFAIELEDGIRISIRSKGKDISKVAIAFGGGGHKVAAGFTLRQSELQESIDTILLKIKELGLLNGK